MSTISQISGTLHRCFERPERGVVGLADELLALCAEQGLELDWQKGRCRVRSQDDGSEEVLVEPVPKGVFRALLARVAALGNALRADCVSPYGGEFDWESGRGARAKVSFGNTASEQRLGVSPL